MTVQNYLSILVFRRVSILAFLIATVVIVMGVTVMLPKTYTSTATLLIDVKLNDPLGGVASLCRTSAIFNLYQSLMGIPLFGYGCAIGMPEKGFAFAYRRSANSKKPCGGLPSQYGKTLCGSPVI